MKLTSGITLVTALGVALAVSPVRADDHDHDKDKDRDHHVVHHDHDRDHDRDRDHDGDQDHDRDAFRALHHGDHDRDDHHIKRAHTHPPGWDHGRKTGWRNCNLPPGQAKKEGCRDYDDHHHIRTERTTTRPAVVTKPHAEVHAHAGVEAEVK